MTCSSCYISARQEFKQCLIGYTEAELKLVTSCLWPQTYTVTLGTYRKQGPWRGTRQAAGPPAMIRPSGSAGPKELQLLQAPKRHRCQGPGTMWCMVVRVHIYLLQWFKNQFEKKISFGLDCLLCYSKRNLLKNELSGQTTHNFIL